MGDRINRCGSQSQIPFKGPLKLMRSRIVQKTVSIIFWLYTERELIQISLLFNSTKFDLKSQHEKKGCCGLERTMSICILYRSLEGLKITWNNRNCNGTRIFLLLSLDQNPRKTSS